MRGRAVPLHTRAEQREAAEHGIERIERAGARDDEHVGTLGAERAHLVGDGARRGACEADR